MNASKLRREFLKNAEPFITEMVEVASGERDLFKSTNTWAIREVWETLSEIIKKADDPVAVTFTDKETSNKVDAILDHVASGEITPAEGKRIMALVAMGFEITELPELMAKFEQLEDKK